MQLQLRQQQLIYLYPVVFVLMLVIYGLSLISLGLAVAFAFAALALICIQMIAKAQRLNVRAQDNLFHQSECLRQLNAMKEIIKADRKTTILVNPDIKPFDLFRANQPVQESDK